MMISLIEVMKVKSYNWMIMIKFNDVKIKEEIDKRNWLGWCFVVVWLGFWWGLGFCWWW